MNEIIGPIYYTFANDADTDVKEFAEADAFFCFTQLMSAMRDFFLNTMDNTVSSFRERLRRHKLRTIEKNHPRRRKLYKAWHPQVSGIGAMMNRFMNQLRDLDPELHQKLTSQDIKPQFYAFRWITLLLSQVKSDPYNSFTMTPL